MSEIPKNLYRAEQVRAIDQAAIAAGIAGYKLMNRAGEAAFAALRRRWPKAQRLLVCCGGGNNGGDGYVLARMARQAGLQVNVLGMLPIDALKGDAKQAAAAYLEQGGSFRLFDEYSSLHGECDLIVDALLGTGLQREVTGLWQQMIEGINAHGAPVFALDIPSGLHADTGAVMGVAVRAAITITFIALKQGLFTGEGPEYCGQLELTDLGVPASVTQQFEPSAKRITQGDLSIRLPPRPRYAHKGLYGHVLVIGGNQGMPGAARMSAHAALRVGAGLVSVATHPSHAAVLNLTRPELMVHAVQQAEQLAPLLKRATVVAAGPGLGQDDWAQEFLRAALESSLPLVIDADGLNLLAQLSHRRADWILTPHPGEAGRLLGISTTAVQSDRFNAVHALVARYGGVAILKGNGTLICDGQRVSLCDAGNPGMASGGMGDVLTGVIAGFLAQGLNLFDAARLGVFAHARAGDLAARKGQRGLLALDLMPHLRALVNK